MTVPYLTPLFESVEYPWEILPLIKEYIKKVKLPEGYVEYKSGVFIGENVKIASTATIEALCVIGSNTEIRPGAYIRGNVITGEGCVIGNSTELKNCILLNGVQVPHYNYVGDSILGNRAHMGAGSICSNLKSDGSNVTLKLDDGTRIETGLRKVGAILADHADIGCGCVLNPGTVIGRGTTVYPLTSVRGVMPQNSIVKALDNIVERK